MMKRSKINTFKGKMQAGRQSFCICYLGEWFTIVADFVDLRRKLIKPKILRQAIKAELLKSNSVPKSCDELTLFVYQEENEDKFKLLKIQSYQTFGKLLQIPNLCLHICFAADMLDCKA